jgi:hypothetical protein
MHRQYHYRSCHGLSGVRGTRGVMPGTGAYTFPDTRLATQEEDVETYVPYPEPVLNTVSHPLSPLR